MLPMNMMLIWDKVVGVVNHQYPDIMNPEDFAVQIGLRLGESMLSMLLVPTIRPAPSIRD